MGTIPFVCGLVLFKGPILPVILFRLVILRERTPARIGIGGWKGERSAPIRLPELLKSHRSWKFLLRLVPIQFASSPYRKNNQTTASRKHSLKHSMQQKKKTGMAFLPRSGLTGWNWKALIAVQGNNGSSVVKLNCMQTRRSVVRTTDTSKVGMKRAKHSWMPVNLRRVSLMSRKQNFESVSSRRKVRSTVAILMIHSLRWVHF